MAEEFAALQEIFKKLEPTPLAHEHPLTSPLSDCFYWADLFTKSPVPRQLKLYGVAFRSVRKYDVVDDTLLYAADAKAFEEAMESRQLLRYWYGNLNERKECLATCIWRSREEAKNAVTAPLHAKAASLAPQFYHKYILDRYWLHCSPDGSHPRNIFGLIDERALSFELFLCNNSVQNHNTVSSKSVPVEFFLKK